MQVCTLGDSDLLLLVIRVNLLKTDFSEGNGLFVHSPTATFVLQLQQCALQY